MLPKNIGHLQIGVHMDYTKRQKEAITTLNQNLQIIACAGSGKTQVISARIIQILKQHSDIKPGNIVAFTFTEKAAGELKDRIYTLAKEELGTMQGFAEMFIGTIHGYCLNLLQSPPVYKYLKFGVLSEIQQRLLIDRYSNQSGLTDTPLLKGENLRKNIDSKLYQQLLEILAEGGVNTSKIPQGVLVAASKYHKLREEKRYLDYTTIIAEAVNTVKKNPEVRKNLARQVKFLVVDEYQDVNPLQESLVKEFEKLGSNICIVGDDDQTIYQWRGSDVSNIITFSERYPLVKEISLVDNFRSNIGIVDAAQKVIENNNPKRLSKKMKSAESQEFERGDLLALNFESTDTESAWVAEKIKNMYAVAYKDKIDSKERGLTFGDFAILLRSVKRDAPPIIRALEKMGIAYIVVGMNGLFDTSEVQAMRNIYYYLADFEDPNSGIKVTRKKLEGMIRDAQLGVSTANVKTGLDFLDAKKLKMLHRISDELNLQKVYLEFLEKIEIREERISDVRHANAGEVVFYNLGKFSQVISDYEQIHYLTPAAELYANFAKFLYYQAADYYPEGWQDESYTKPDAVQILTVHQAKGMQWPVVLIPCLRQNRFPSKRMGGRSVWNIIPDISVKNVDRYKGTVEDERRLFYVAVTRAEKYLFCSFSPGESNLYKKVSGFFREFTSSEFVLTKDPDKKYRKSKDVRPRKIDVNIALTFSELKYYFECPYMFKLRFLYGFNPPLVQPLGYGKSLHDMLAEIHAESIRGNIPSVKDVPKLVDAHLHVPFASPPVFENLQSAAVKSITRYLQEHRENLDKLEHAEKIIELKLNDGIVVNGRIDLIRRTDTGETIIVDFKSDARAQAEDITMKQLHVYAFGYQQLTGGQADLIEVHNLDKGGAKREIVDADVVSNTISNIVEAGKNLRENILPRLPNWEGKCVACDVAGVCRTKPVHK